MLKRLAAIGLAALPIVLPLDQAVSALAPGNGTLAFEVDRNGDRVGTHALTFSRAGDALDIRVQTQVAVKVAFITAYRFEHTGHEMWQGGKLAALESTTNDDGTRHALKVARSGDALAVEADGKTGSLSGDLFTGSLWNRDLVSASSLLNTLDGSRMNVTITTIGTENVDVSGKAVAATHVTIRGDLVRDLWYDASDRLVRMSFKGKDGSDIVYRLVRCDFC